MSWNCKNVIDANKPGTQSYRYREILQEISYFDDKRIVCHLDRCSPIDLAFGLYIRQNVIAMPKVAISMPNIHPQEVLNILDSNFKKAKAYEIIREFLVSYALWNEDIKCQLPFTYSAVLSSTIWENGEDTTTWGIQGYDKRTILFIPPVIENVLKALYVQQPFVLVGNSLEVKNMQESLESRGCTLFSSISPTYEGSDVEILDQLCLCFDNLVNLSEEDYCNLRSSLESLVQKNYEAFCLMNEV